jgi:hypothetical protein
MDNDGPFLTITVISAHFIPLRIPPGPLLRQVLIDGAELQAKQCEVGLFEGASITYLPILLSWTLVMISVMYKSTYLAVAIFYTPSLSSFDYNFLVMSWRQPRICFVPILLWTT